MNGAGDNPGINFAGWAIGLAVLVLIVLPLFVCFCAIPLAGALSGGK